jgi:hypothetical protein
MVCPHLVSRRGASVELLKLLKQIGQDAIDWTGFSGEDGKDMVI